ncbi:MAG: tRNA lysidine(34) synthetase TilS [Myxococcales bacterium]|nr:tRNA lysidine(34) synthetase TilS [Myxococcales bacterium]MCB9708153.1 tRNA lysidine(34) synthetase TilS [Myxococcales bacterium]
MARTIEERSLLGAGDVVLIACSGGPDSMAMLHVLSMLARRMRFSVMVASVDHQLRQESGREVLRVAESARDLGVPFFPLKVQMTKGASVQAEARRLRYAALLELGRQQQATRVAVGHTRDDQAETVLERVMRGAGIEGLGGIAPARSDGVVRPLIDVSRSQVLAYLKRFDIGFIDDPSNREQRFKRTRIRERILPLLAAEDPSIFAHLSQLADDARAVVAGLRRDADILLEHCHIEARLLDADRMMQASESVRRMALRMWIEEVTCVRPNRAQLLAAERTAGGTGEVWLKHGWSLRKVGSVLKAVSSVEPNRHGSRAREQEPFH